MSNVLLIGHNNGILWPAYHQARLLQLAGCPKYLLSKPQKVQNNAARLIETLHWLPVTRRIQYKISTICFSSISGTAPQYRLLQPYTSTRQLRSASDTRTFVTSGVNTKTIGERSFSHAGPSVWKNLPQTLRHTDSASSFKAVPQDAPV